MSASTTSANHYVVPFVAAMDASGSAAFEYVQQETVSITGIDYTFDAQLSSANSKKLLEAFTVSGNGPADSFLVTLSNSADLQAVLASVINGADEAKNGAADATSQLIADLHAGLTAAIGTDTLINTVENLDVTAVDVTIDAAGGAAAMAAGLTDAKCDLIYTQIPEAALNLYKKGGSGTDQEDQVTDALPLQQGDVITFVFDVDLSDVVPTKTQVNTGETGAANGGGDVAGEYTSSLHYNLASKRIAFNIQMSGSTGAFSGLRAASA